MYPERWEGGAAPFSLQEARAWWPYRQRWGLPVAWLPGRPVHTLWAEPARRPPRPREVQGGTSLRMTGRPDLDSAKIALGSAQAEVGAGRELRGHQRGVQGSPSSGLTCPCPRTSFWDRTGPHAPWEQPPGGIRRSQCPQWGGSGLLGAGPSEDPRGEGPPGIPVGRGHHMRSFCKVAPPMLPPSPPLVRGPHCPHPVGWLTNPAAPPLPPAAPLSPSCGLSTHEPRQGFPMP